MFLLSRSIICAQIYITYGVGPDYMSILWPEKEYRLSLTALELVMKHGYVGCMPDSQHRAAGEYLSKGPAQTSYHVTRFLATVSRGPRLVTEGDLCIPCRQLSPGTAEHMPAWRNSDWCAARSTGYALQLHGSSGRCATVRPSVVLWTKCARGKS